MRYQSASGHHLLLETIQYAAGDDILTKQVLHAKIKEKLSLSFSQPGPELPDAFYFIEKRYMREKKLISKAMFEAKLRAPGTVMSLHETIEELLYTDRAGSRCGAVVVMTRDSNSLRKAKIEFTSDQQLEAFVAPDWLVAPEDR